jgi:hypothetical protein
MSVQDVEEAARLTFSIGNVLAISWGFNGAKRKRCIPVCIISGIWRFFARDRNEKGTFLDTGKLLGTMEIKDLYSGLTKEDAAKFVHLSLLFQDWNSNPRTVSLNEDDARERFIDLMRDIAAMTTEHVGYFPQYHEERGQGIYAKTRRDW